MTTLTEQMYPAPIPQSPPLDGPILLRDGRPAFLRRGRRSDVGELVALLSRSSAASRYFRFFGTATDNEQLARRMLAEGSDVAIADKEGKQVSDRALTLIVTTGHGEDDRIIGVGSYAETAEGEAESAFFVQDDFQGKGIGTLLLERLAFAAEAAGLKRLVAVVLPENHQMLVVFQSSGFQIDRHFEDGEIQISLALETTEKSVQSAEERDRIATINSLEPFFRPTSVAVIGASRKPDSIGYRVLQNLITTGFNGPVYPINPKADVVASIPAYGSVLDVPRDVDLAVIAVPQPVVLTVVDECAKKGVRGLVVLTAGFAETGEEGSKLQDELVRKVRGAGMRMVGPNCLGFLNLDADVKLNATFGPVAPLPGRVAMSSQSGALGLAIIEYAKDLGLGLSSFVSVGNKADISGNDLIQFWEDDEQTDLILLYLESFGNPRRFSRLARRVGRKKPILAVKSGRTSAGRRAAGSHTAALAASDVGTGALFRQAGVIRADTLEEMFDVASLLAHQPIPRGNRIAILTNAGGPGILAADACEAEGLVLPTLSDVTREKLMEFLPAAASVANPVDMVASASADDYRRALSLILDDENVDAVITIFIPTGSAGSQEVAAGVRAGRLEAATGKSKPLLGNFMSLTGMHTPLATEEEAIPSYRFPESAAKALARATEHGMWLGKPQGIIPHLDNVDVTAARDVCKRALEARGEGWLLPEEVTKVLNAFGIRMIETPLAKSAEEAVAIADRLGYPVVVKLASATLIHKTEWDGVHLDLKSGEEVKSAFGKIADNLQKAGRQDEMLGVTIQRMARSGTEVLIGMTEDPSFGPLVAFGLGGISVELLGDVVFRITPLTDQDAAEMITGIKGYKLLDGYRNTPPRDKEVLADMLLRVSRLVEEVPQIVDLDFNPVRVYNEGEGAEVLDARIMVR